MSETTKLFITSINVKGTKYDIRDNRFPESEDTGSNAISMRDGASAQGASSVAMGANTVARGDYSHAEGYSTVAEGLSSHAEGELSIAKGSSSHAEGNRSVVKGGAHGGHAEGSYAYIEKLFNKNIKITRKDNKKYSFNPTILQINNLMSGDYIEYKDNKGNTKLARIESINLLNSELILSEDLIESNTEISCALYIVTQVGSNALGAHAEGIGTYAAAIGAHSEGHQTRASGEAAHAEGMNTFAKGAYSHAEGYGWAGVDSYGALGDYSHAEGNLTTASGQASHAEGMQCQANKDMSHAEGRGSIANGLYSHAEGDYCTTSSWGSHAGGTASSAGGIASFAHGEGVQAKGDHQFAIGKYNQPEDIETTNASTKAFIIGNGSKNKDTNEISRSNCFEIDWNGAIYVPGTDTDGSKKMFKLTISKGQLSIVPVES